MNKRDTSLLSNEAIPESVRAALAQGLLSERSSLQDLELEQQKLELESRKFIWNTPLVMALAGLITLTGTFITERWTRKDATQNAITLEQLKHEIGLSEKRLKQQLDERTKKTDAEIAASAKEREFQYKIVTAELADKSKTQLDRAAVLYFLARAGVLNTLNSAELKKMATEQEANPTKVIIPQLTPSSDSWFDGTRLEFESVGHISEMPWQVALVRANTRNQFCNGALVRENWVLTAAHCLDGPGINKNSDRLGVVAGTLSYASGGELINVSEVHIHPSWSPATYAFDVALLKLDGATKLGKPIALLSPGRSPIIGEELKVAGWHPPSRGGSGSATLQFATVPVVSNATCNAPISYDGSVTPEMMCAGKREGGADACQGFGGSPAVGVRSGAYIAQGIVSWGHGCGLPHKYGVYTRVSSVFNWVSETMSAN